MTKMQKRVTEDDTSSIASDSDSSSLFSDDESVSSSDDEMSIAEEDIKLLEKGIEHRQKLFLKLLEGREETESAKNLRERELRVNYFLLKSLRIQLKRSEEPTSSPIAPSCLDSSSHDDNAVDTMRRVFVRECQFTVPGIISLITHCSLYLSIYGCLSKFIEWTCDKIIIYLTAWHISENAFDCSHHERLYHIVWLLIGIWMSRITGSIWAWNDNKTFQHKLKEQMHSRSKSSWDMQMTRWFAGKGRHKSKKWGPRMKLFLDTLSFFLVYLAVDRLLIRDFGDRALNSRSTILAGMPSRQLKTRVSGITDVDRGADQCTLPESDASNDTAAELCLSSFIVQEDFTSDIMNWLENRNRCRWVEEDAEDNEEDGEKIRAWPKQTDEWKQLINARDEQYLQENVSYKTYYELVGDPSAQFIDPVLETWFYLLLALGGFAVLFSMGSPFLLI
jgi:hypothetical protein